MKILARDASTVPDTYMSFAGPEGFRGAVVVAEPDPAKALAIATRAGLNPGGEVALFAIPPDIYPRMTLLDRATLESLGACKLGDLSADEQAQVEANSFRVRDECNVGAGTHGADA